MFLSNFSNLFHVAWSSCDVYREDGFGFGSDFFFNPIRINIHIWQIDINKNGFGAGMNDGIGCRAKGHRGSDDLISWF